MTRFGWGCLFMAALTLMSAASTGNNLLYLLYSACLAALILSAAAGWLNLRGLSVRAELPDQIFRGADFPMRLIVANNGRWTAFGVTAAGGACRVGLESIGPRAQAAAELRYRFPHRGMNGIDDLALESLFPFGFFRHRRAVSGVTGLALPRLREIQSAAQIKADARASGRATLRKGMGEELYGIREYDPSDDSRSINWKLSAKTGRPLVNEHCAAVDSKVTVRVAGETGEGVEGRIEEAASACRYYIDSGAEVRLVTPREEIEYGKGLLHLERVLKALALLGEGAAPRPSAAPASPEASQIPDSLALRRLTMAGAILVFSAVFLIDEVNPWMLAAVAPVFPLGWFLQERRRGVLSPWVWNALSAAVLLFILSDWRLSGVTVANTHLLLYLLANRVLIPFDRRELGQIFLIFFLAFFLVSGLTISLWYFVFFLLYVSFAALWLMLASRMRLKPFRASAPALAGLVLAGLSLTAAAFAATPRVEGLRRINPFIAAGIDKLQVRSSSVMGFTESVSLGYFGELKRSSARVMRVKPPLPAGHAYPAPLQIRGSSFDAFDGRRWSKGKVEFRYRLRNRLYASAAGRGWAARRGGDQLVFPAQPAARSSPIYEFTIYPMSLSVLFTVGTPWLVEGIEDATYFDYTDSIYLAAPYMAGVRYRLYANLDQRGFADGQRGYDAILAERFLQLPPDPQGRVHELARRVTASAADPLGKIGAVEGYLRRNYGYSTFSDSGGRTLEDFLFKSRRGNCEYFATAGVILLRHAGVAARLVTGFNAEDWNEYGRFFDVRQHSAHAWVEAYVPGRGWFASDPTPSQGLFSASADVLGRRMERWFNAIQVEWYRHVIGYDQYVQGNTFRRLGVALSPDLLASWGVFGFKALCVIGAVFGLFPIAVRLRKLFEPGPAEFFLRAQAALERAGLGRPSHLTPREYARWVIGSRPELAALGPLAELHYLERYSPRRLPPGQAEEARRLYEDIRSRL